MSRWVTEPYSPPWSLALLVSVRTVPSSFWMIEACSSRLSSFSFNAALRASESDSIFYGVGTSASPIGTRKLRAYPMRTWTTSPTIPRFSTFEVRRSSIFLILRMVVSFQRKKVRSRRYRPQRLKLHDAYGASMVLVNQKGISSASGVAAAAAVTGGGVEL